MIEHWKPDFEQLVDEHQAMVYALARRMVGDSGLAEEIAQDTFLALDSELRHLESAEHARRWLCRVAMRRAIDALRRRHSRGVDRWTVLEDVHPISAESAISPLGARIELLLAELPEAQRAALVLRYQEDLLPDEIASVLAAPVATVKSHLQRGLKQLRSLAACRLKEYLRNGTGSV